MGYWNGEGSGGEENQTLYQGVQQQRRCVGILDKGAGGGRPPPRPLLVSVASADTLACYSIVVAADVGVFDNLFFRSLNDPFKRSLFTVIGRCYSTIFFVRDRT